MISESECIYYKVPKEVADKLKDDLNSMGDLMKELIELQQTEKRNKKNHKAYRHVREYMDVLYEASAAKVKQIDERWKDLKFDEHFVSNEEGSEPLKELAKTVAVQMGEKDLNEILQGMVMMPSETLGMMQDDMLVLAETVDLMTTLFKIIISGHPFDYKETKRMLAKVSIMTDEISERWEDAEVKVIV